MYEEWFYHLEWSYKSLCYMAIQKNCFKIQLTLDLARLYCEAKASNSLINVNFKTSEKRFV